MLLNYSVADPPSSFFTIRTLLIVNERFVGERERFVGERERFIVIHPSNL